MYVCKEGYREYPLRRFCQQEKVRKEDQDHGTWFVQYNHPFCYLNSTQTSYKGLSFSHKIQCLGCKKPSAEY